MQDQDKSLLKTSEFLIMAVFGVMMVDRTGQLNRPSHNSSRSAEIVVYGLDQNNAGQTFINSVLSKSRRPRNSKLAKG